jgi:hypothetical protein
VVAALSLVAGIAGAPACGASANGGVPFVAIRPEDARLSAAANALSASVGHDLDFEVDAAVLKVHAPVLQERLSDALETITRALEAARAERPDDVAATCAKLVTLRVELDEKIRDHRATVTGGVLVLRVPTKVAAFTTDAAVRDALLAAE